MLCLVLEVGEGGLELGFEGRGVGVEDRKVREVVQETRAMILDVGEGLLEAEFEGIVFGW